LEYPLEGPKFISIAPKTAVGKQLEWYVQVSLVAGERLGSGGLYWPVVCPTQYRTCCWNSGSVAVTILWIGIFG